MKSESPTTTQEHRLQHQVSKNWYILAGVTVCSTIGMAVAIAPALADQVGAVWPWKNTHLVLLCGLVVSVAMLVVHLTVQQRRVGRFRAQVSLMEKDSQERERQSDARMRALLNISRMMGAVTNPENVFQCITDTCIEIFGCQQASLMLLNPSRDELEVKAATGHQTSVTGTTQPVSSGPAGWVARTQNSLVLNPDTDLTKYPDLQLRGNGLSAAMVVPIMVRDELVGVLNASSRTPGAHYTDDDLQSLSVFAENAGTVIRHSEHAEWMRKTIENLRAQLDRMQPQPS